MKKIIKLSIVGLMLLLSLGAVSAMEVEDVERAYVLGLHRVMDKHAGQWCPTCMFSLNEEYEQLKQAVKDQNEPEVSGDAQYARELYEKEKEADASQRNADERLAKELSKELNPGTAQQDTDGKLAQELFREINPGNELPTVQDDQDDSNEEECGICYEGFDKLTPCCKQTICFGCWEKSIKDKSLCPFCRKAALQ